MKTKRNRSKSLQQRAKRYYFLGLNSKEIAKLLDCSYKTIQGYAQRGNWTAQRKARRQKE